MDHERLAELLGSLRHERMGRAADLRARERLEHEWAALQQRRGSWRRTFARAVIGLGFVALVAFTVLRSPGDSPLYGARVAIEDAFANVYMDPQARIQYLLDLYEQRQAEAARLEAMGSAASSGARRIEERTLATLRSLLPQAPDDEPAPSASPSLPAVVAASPSPFSATPPPAIATAVAAAPSPTGQPQPTATPPPRPSATVTVVTPRPTPTPIKTDLFPVVLNGTVVEPSGGPAHEVCVSVIAGTCQTRTTAAGVYKLTVTARVGQSVTVSAWIADATGRITFKGAVSVVVKASAIQVPTISLKPY